MIENIVVFLLILNSMNFRRFKLKKYFRLFAKYNCWNLKFWYVDWNFSFVAMSDFEFRNDHFVRFTKFISSWCKEIESCQKHFFELNIVLLFHALTCNEKKNWRWRFRRFLNANKIEFSMIFSMKFSNWFDDY